MRTIILDIETAPSLAYVWGVWKQNVSQDMLLTHTYIMSCSIKELGNPNVMYFENRTDNDYEIVGNILKELDNSDFVIAHNGRKFDLPLIRSRAIHHGYTPPSPFKIIDTLDIAKKEFRFIKNTLENLAIELDVPLRKLSHSSYPGFKLWLGCLQHEESAWKEMKQYNIMDVEVLEQVYLKLRPWHSQHPNIVTASDSDDMCCPKCGSKNLIRSGYYYTNKGKYQRYACKSCGAWSSETYVKNTKEKRQSLLASR